MPQLALVPVPGAVPEFALHPGHAGDEAVGLDGAQQRTGVGIDLVDFPVAVLSDPQRAFGPRQSRVAAAAGSRQCREHAAGGRVDLLDAVFRELEEVAAVECGAGVSGDRDVAAGRAGGRIERAQAIAGREPDVAAVEGHAVHVVGAGEGSVLAEDVCL